MTSLDWKQTTFGDATQIKQGRYLSKADMFDARRETSLIPVHGANGVIGWTSKPMYSYGVPLVTCRGSNCGMVLWADGPLWVSNNAMAILPKGNDDIRFLYYYLLGSPPYKFVSGSAQPQITMGDLSKKKLLLPPLPEQRAIAATLGALDDKIGLNRRMNETLEAMARVIFKDWLVDFGPTRAKAAGRAPYLASEIWNLFPDTLDDGDTPVGWELRCVSKFAKIKGGKQLSKDKFVEDGHIPIFGGAGLMGYTDSNNADGFVISVGRVGAYCGQFFSHRGKAWINNNASLIIPFDGVSSEWLLLALRSLNMDLIKKGAAQPFVSNSDIAAMDVVDPGEAVLAAFHDCILGLMLRQEANQRGSATLAQIRNVLLPKLMSGGIRVADADKIIQKTL